jgi:hypothetical protein
MDQRKAQSWVMAGFLVGLGLAAFHLATDRIYQVDEAQNLYMTRVVGVHQAEAFFTNALLWMLGPLAWAAAAATRSVALFHAARLVFLAVFLANVALLAANTGVRLRSRLGLAALCGAATLAPLWDYGFEIRHDNLILTGLLLMWGLGRTWPRGKWSYSGLGFISVVLLFTAFKSFVYVVPISVAFLVFPHPGHGEGRIWLAGAWLGGACLAVLLVASVYGASGLWSVYLAGFQSGLQASEGGNRFGPGLALGRLVHQIPLALGLSAGALLALAGGLRTQGRAALSWEGWAPEAALCLGALGVLLINPTPFPYNLVNLVPFTYLLAFRFLCATAEAHGAGRLPAALLAGILAFTHLLPFAVATWRHLDWTNERQETLMNLAEAMTDPTKDRVYDAIGMVPTRSSIGFHWYLHSLNIQTFVDGKGPRLPQMLTERPPAVFIPSYRTDWLPAADWTFIKSRYIALADDFWVLGQVLPTGGGRYLTVHPGRYQLVGLKDGRTQSLTNGFLDGLPLPLGPIELGEGGHELTCPPDLQLAVIWLGPRLQRLPALGQGNHQRLFTNWY